MEKSGTLSQNIRISRGQTATVNATQADFNADVHHHLNEDEGHYHAQKLGLGRSGSHEGWIRSEEVEAELHGPVGVDVRHKMIAVAAFYLAEKRGFEGNDTYEDWMLFT